MNDLSLSNKSPAKTFRKRWGSVWQQGLMNCTNDGESDKQSQKIGAKQQTAIFKNWSSWLQPPDADIHIFCELPPLRKEPFR